MTAAARSLFAVIATAWTAPTSGVTERPANTLWTAICRRAAPYLFLAAATLGPAASVWSVGPDPLIDFGRELYVPWRITEGDVLYRDVAYFNGPV